MKKSSKKLSLNRAVVLNLATGKVQGGGGTQSNYSSADTEGEACGGSEQGSCLFTQCYGADWCYTGV